ncbi:MAG: PQQ-binding-like beta-propeller repeat protein, partial [Armatimonadota bacterium]|nr:PQQ-binding-like beta-propeller repeat protein [Armatimonadota bacterium]
SHDWPVMGGSPGSTHFSSLNQINRSNVAKLERVWSYNTKEEGGLETTPIIVDGVLYAYTPTQEVIALNAATGKLLWEFKSGIVGLQPARGLAYWRSGSDKRILAGIMNFVYALDATTGKEISSFGDNGRVDLRENLGRDPELQSIALTSPGAIYKDLIIVGGREPETLPAPPGDIRAYDVRTGKLRWSFHTIPHPGESGYDTWPKDAWKTSGGTNNWAGMSIDVERGIVYVPTGSAADDFYGTDRVGNDLFADSLIALDASTGKRIWSFQGVRHDIWDRDFPAPPALITVKRGGKEIPAIAQTTKQGWVYLFNRVNGKPLFPIEYKKYPPSTVPGEVAASEQPLPTKPAPYARQLLTADLLTNRTPEAHRWALDQFKTFRSDSQFVPLSLGIKTVVFPGFDGGGEWGGPAVDPEAGILYVNSNDIAATGEIAKHTEAAGGRAVYLSQCSVCHGENRMGSPPQFPSLAHVGAHLTAKQIAATIYVGRGRMPGFPNLKGAELDSLITYLQHGPAKELESSAPAVAATQYVFTGYKKFLDPQGYPAVAPPWGTLNAIDLNTGKYLWKIPFGTYPKLVAEGMKDTGSENYGGPVVTAGGLVFIGATNFDKKFHAFDKATGKLLWETTLLFAGNATPATYEVDGRQYVVIAAGGGKDLGSPSGGVYVAFALPQ